MLDYIISLKIVLLTGAIGGVLGYLVSYLIDTYFLEAQTETDIPVSNIDNKYQRVLNVILWGIALIFIWSAIFVAAAAIDYLLGFAPISHGMRFIETETVTSSFVWGLFAGMVGTLLKFGELAFAALKKD